MNGRVQYAMLRKWIPLATSKERGEPHGRHGRVNDRRMMPSRRLRFDGDFGTPGNRKTLETRHCESRQNEHVALAKNHRKAFTLVEILLVLGVLVVFAGMTVPSVMRMFSEQKITGSAERVREAIASARFRAIESGIIYQFCCEANGTRYVVVPFEPDHVNANGGQGGPVTLLSRAAGSLPKGLVFSSTMMKSLSNSSAANSTTSPAMGSPSHKLPPGSLDGLPKASDLAGANWSMPVLFHPEGSANADMEITISDPKSQHIKLHVRAFTGAVSMDRLATGKR